MPSYIWSEFCDTEYCTSIRADFFPESDLVRFLRSYVVVLGIYYKLQTFLYLPASGIVQECVL